MHHGETVSAQEKVLALGEPDPVQRWEVRLGRGDVLEGKVKIVLLGQSAVYARSDEHLPINVVHSPQPTAIAHYRPGLQRPGLDHVLPSPVDWLWLNRE
jgi:hypothetical protein